MNKPILAFVVCHHEREKALRLANWIRDLGGVKGQDVLVCMNHTGRNQGLYDELQPILSDAFASCSLFVPVDAVEVRWGHPDWDASSANHMMKRVSQHCDWELHRPFLWLEMDAVPTRPTWMDEILAEYATCGKPFMGDKVNNGIHEIHMSGIAVYPNDLARHSTKIRNAGKLAWDLAACSETVPKAHFTPLIQHNYQRPGMTGCHTWQNGKLKPEAALFHQCKCGCLIDHLRGGGCIVEKPSVGAVGTVLHGIPAAQPLPPPKPAGELTLQELVNALVVYSKKDKMAKGRIINLLKVAGIITPPKVVSK